jgi:hypothetical protein
LWAAECRSVALQAFDALEFTEIAIEGPERQVTGFPSHFEHQAVRQSQLRSLSKLADGRRDRLRILKGKMLVVTTVMAPGSSVRLCSQPRSDRCRRLGRRDDRDDVELDQVLPVGHPSGQE